MCVGLPLPAGVSVAQTEGSESRRVRAEPRRPVCRLKSEKIQALAETRADQRPGRWTSQGGIVLEHHFKEYSVFENGV